jgi:LPXTG-motif cell wall-anchored protein
MVFLFGSVALAFYLSEKTGEYSTGFLTVAGIYFLIGIIVYLGQRKLDKETCFKYDHPSNAERR